MYTPADLNFKLCNYPDGRVIELYVIDVAHEDDELGGHNVTGLPARYDAEEMENTWLVYDDSLTDQQVIDELVASGFTHLP